MDEPQGSPATRNEARAAEAAAIRRRWINLGEILAVLAVLISALTLWLNWSDHRDSSAEKAAEKTEKVAKAATLVLTADASSSGKRLDIKPASADQTIQEQTIIFPSSLGLDPVKTTGEPRIEAKWFDGALKKAREKAGLPDDSRGDERLPVLIQSRFISNDDTHEDSAIYDIGYTIKGQMFAGHDVTLRGLSLVRHAGSKSTSVLESRWNSLFPAKKD
jgi:hypothetical protein